MLCHRWQDLESHMMRSIGIPQVIIRPPDNCDDIRAWSHVDIDRVIECSPEREALHAELRAQQSMWNAEAKALRFDEIKQLEAEAWDQESRASEVVFNTEATSLWGVEIKIAVILELVASGSNDPDFPWPQLRSTLRNLQNLRRAASTSEPKSRLP
jgi:hypothetical protein